MKSGRGEELEIDLLPEDSLVKPFKKEILALCEAFNNSGQSGGSAPYTSRAIADAMEKLFMGRTLAPLSGEDWEWGDEEFRGVQQNLRDSRVFRNPNTDTGYFIDAFIFIGEDGMPFSGGNDIFDSEGNEISSKQYIKSFPFTPKTFYIDVNDQRWAEDKVTPDDDGHWWTHTINDESQLKQAQDYYDNKG